MPAAAPINFDDTNSPSLVVPTVLDASGAIRYHQAYPDVTQEYDHEAGSYHQTGVFVPWAKAGAFLAGALGYTRWDGAETTRFNRVLPMVSPLAGSMRCSNARLADFGMFAGSQRVSSVSKWLEADWARYQLTFRHRRYTLLTDAQVDSNDYPWATYGCKELGRYVIRQVRYVTEALKLGNAQLETYNAANPAEAPNVAEGYGFVPRTKGEIIYIWHQIPYDAVPIAKIGELSLTVNSAAFDKWNNGAAWVDLWPAQSLLFQGLAEEIEPYPSPSGELFCDVKYRFSYQPTLWNKWPVVSGATLVQKDLRRRGTTCPLFLSADFRPLFQPRSL